MSVLGREHPLEVLRRVDWWVVLVATTIALIGLLLIHSATQYDPRFVGQHKRQTLFFCVSAGMAVVLILVPYPRIMRIAWLLYGLALLSLAFLPVFGSTINGARRWYMLPGFAIQPSEFAKLAVIVALAAWLRFRTEGRLLGNLVIPVVITAVPALMVMRQPDLGSSLVFWPILLAMSFAAGASIKQMLASLGIGLVVVALLYVFLMHGYQKARVDTWAGHFPWRANAQAAEEIDVRKQIHGPAYQPWQSLIAVGSGGVSGFGLGAGPQNRYDFLPYRNADYIFSVLAEEQGLVGVLALLGLQALLVMLLLRLAFRSRERFGRLLIVGVAAFIGTQALMHIAVCTWLVPATGLPMPLVSYGGSSTMAAVLALGLAVGVGARRQPVVAADAFA